VLDTADPMPGGIIWLLCYGGGGGALTRETQPKGLGVSNLREHNTIMCPEGLEKNYAGEDQHQL
jgi:hypothetical protein